MTKERKAELRALAENARGGDRALLEALDYIAELEQTLVDMCTPFDYPLAIRDQIDFVLSPPWHATPPPDVR